MIREKQNQLRYLVLDRCFADTRHKYTAIDLSKKVGEAIWGELGAQVNPRLVLGDVKYMKEATAFQAPIEEFPTKNGKSWYRYSKKNYSIFHNALPFEAINTLCSSLSSLYLTLQRFQNENCTRSCEFLNTIIPYLENRLGISKENPSLPEQKFNLQGLEHLTKIVESIISFQPLKIHYHTFNDREFDIFCDPYHVGLHDDKWYMMARTEQYSQMGYYALERIESLKPLEDKLYILQTDSDLETYMKIFFKDANFLYL